MENLPFQPNVVYLFPIPPESRQQNSVARPAKYVPILVAFHFFVTIGLSALGTCLQFEFYKEHDVLPGYALWLAIAGAVGMLSLSTLKFEGKLTDLWRKTLCVAFYCFMVISSSYHVLNAAWTDASKVTHEVDADSITRQSNLREKAIGSIAEALDKATKHGAWKEMGTLGTALATDLPAKLSTPSVKPLGISSELMIGAGALIVIALRALLEAMQVITAVAVRDYFLSKARSA